MSYTFIDKEGDATEDVIVKPDTGDTIILAGSALDASDKIIADNDNAVDAAWEVIEFTCIVADYWNTNQLMGTWDDNGAP